MTNRRETLAALAFGAAILVLAVLAPWLRFVLTLALAKGIAALGVMLLLRAGQVSFGHALYLAFAAYVVAFAAAQVPEALLLIPLAIAASSLLGLLIGLFVVRYREIFFGMLNLALSMVFYSLLEKFYAITHGTDGLRVPTVTWLGTSPGREEAEWLGLGAAVLLALGFAWFARRYLASPMGEALSAIKTREARLEFMGLPPRRVLLVAYVLSAAMVGTAGALVALTTRHVTPLLGYWTASGELVFIVILGGAGGVLGPFLGAIAYELVRVYASAAVADAWQLILGCVLLGVILFARGGLLSLLGKRA
jgi:branched-chain amino acid transport system permease protein